MLMLHPCRSSHAVGYTRCQSKVDPSSICSNVKLFMGVYVRDIRDNEPHIVHDSSGAWFEGGGPHVEGLVGHDVTTPFPRPKACQAVALFQGHIATPLPSYSYECRIAGVPTLSVDTVDPLFLLAEE